MADPVVHVTGLTEFQRALRLADKESQREIRKAQRASAEPVRREARAQFASRGFSRATVSGIRVAVRATGVSVEQSRRRKTGKRGDFGANQQGRLDVILEEKTGEIVHEFEQATERITEIVRRNSK